MVSGRWCWVFKLPYQRDVTLKLFAAEKNCRKRRSMNSYFVVNCPFEEENLCSKRESGTATSTELKAWIQNSGTDPRVQHHLQKPVAQPGCSPRWRWVRRAPEALWRASPPSWLARPRWQQTCRTAHPSWTAGKDWRQSNVWWRNTGPNIRMVLSPLKYQFALQIKLCDTT